MSERQEGWKGRRRDGSRHRMMEAFGIVAFFVLAAAISVEVFRGMASFGYVWLVPFLAVVAYLAADLASGFVHFALDNFGYAETPVVGPNFIKPFRDHHTDPLGITRHDFIGTNGNNSIVSVPFMAAVWLFAPVSSTVWGYLFGTFFLFLCLGVFLTNQFHKWAHMEEPPGWVARLQSLGVILSKEHHEVHHESPYDTYYCITVGVWNPLLDKIGFFERTERLLRRVVPGADPRLRSEREGNPN